MKQHFNRLFASLLDQSGCLGVGLLDRNGLLIQSSGEHDGHSANALAAIFASLYNPAIRVLERALTENLDDQILLGKKHHVHLCKVKKQYILYSFAAANVTTGKAHSALKQAQIELEQLLDGKELFESTYQRIEQPRQFMSRGLAGTRF